MTKSAQPSNTNSRDLLIQAGLEQFGSYGYNTVSVRQICEQANLNIASVKYYFGGKEGLYLAVADHIKSKLNTRMWPVVEPIFKFLDSGETDKAQALEYVQDVIIAMAEILIPESVEAECWARFITRFQLGDDTPDHDLSRHNVGELMTQLVGLICRSENDTDTQKTGHAMLAQMLFGQALVFRVSRNSSKHMLGIERFGDEEFEQIKQLLRRNVTSILREYIDDN